MRKISRWVLLILLAAVSLSFASALADSAIPALTVNGQTEGISLAFNEAPTIRVMVPGGATALIVEAERISNPDGTPLSSEEEQKEWSEWYDRYRLRPVVDVTGKRFFDKGIWLVTAKYTADDYEDGEDLGQGVQWTVLSSVEVIVSDYLARMDPPSIALAASSVSRGGWLEVTLSSFQQKNEWYWYELAKMEDSGDWGDWFGHTDVTLKEGVSSSFFIPTLDLDPGTYRLGMHTEAISYEDSGFYKTFIVAESGSLADGITLSAASVPVDVQNEINLRAAGADQMKVSATLDEDPFWQCDPFWLDGGAGTWRTSFDRAGTYRLTLTAYEGGISRTAGTAVMAVTASDYLAPPVYSGFPSVLASGQGLEGTLVLDPRTERTYVDLSFCPDDGDWESLYDVSMENTTPAAEALSLPASLFVRDGRYRLHVNAHAAGIESGQNEYWLIRSSANSGGVTLKVNGGTSPVTVPSSTDVHLEIIAPTATAARILNGDRWEYRGDPGEFAFDMRLGSGDFALVAQITTDTPSWRDEGFDWSDFRWENLNWGAYSNAVSVHAESTNGRLNQPTVTLEADTVARGEWLRAAVDSQGRGEWYWAQVRRLWLDEDGNTQWDHVMDCYGDGTGGFVVPGIALEPGSYCLTVSAAAIGWESAERSVPFTVTGSSAPLPQVALFFPQSTILTSQDTAFCAYADGADFVTVDVSWYEDPGWNNHYEDDDGVNTWNFSCSQSGTYVFALHAWKNGESMGEDSFTLHVSAPYGTLEAPAVQGIPAVMATNTAVAGSLIPDASATAYDIQLTFCPEDGPWDTIYDSWRDADWADASELSFPAEFFSRPGIYRLEIHTSAPGYNGAHLSKKILAADSELQQRLALSVNADQIYLHQNVQVTVDAPSDVTAVRLWSSSYDRWDYRVSDGSGFSWYWGFHSGGDETLMAQGTTDPAVLAWLEDHGRDGMWDFDWSQVSWTVSSSPVAVHVIQYGNLYTPQVEFPQGTSVERGQMLQLTIAPVQNAYSYGVQVRRADEDNGNWLIDLDFSDLPETSLVSVPTDCLEPGSYMLHVDPRCYGWHGDSRAYPFTVTQGAFEAEEPVFRLSATELLTREHVTCSIYAPGAEEVMWRIGDHGNQRQAWGDSLADCIVFFGESSYVMTAWARYPGDDDWTQIGDERTVIVSAPNGAMEITLQAPGSVQISDTILISAVCDFKGTNGSVDCYICPAEDEQATLLEPVSEYDEDGLRHITYQVSADTLAIGPYFITGYALPGARGYDVGYDEIKIDVTAGTLDATLTVNPNPAEIFDDIHISLQAPGAAAVALYGSVNGMGWIYAPGDSIEEDQTMWQDGDHILYGLYTTEEIDPEAEGFDWESVHWEGMSNSVSLVVNPPSAELEEMNASVEKSTVKRGERLKVSILNDNPGLEVSYGASLQPLNDEGNGYSWYGPEEDDGKTIWVETLEAEAGEYRLMISANARGCLPVITWIPVTVTAADDGLRVAVREHNVITGNMIRVVGFSNGAVRICMDISFENGTWEPEPAHIEADGDCLNTEVFMGEHPDTVLLELTAAYADGSSEILQKRIAVTAPKGAVHPRIQLNSAWQPGKDLDFSVTVEADAQYVAFVQEPGAEEAVFARFVPPGTATRQFHLSKDEYTFEAGKAYEILVIAAGTGYDGRQSFLPITRSTSSAVLRLPSGLKTIEEDAFAGVAAEKIVVPYGVRTIGSNAFSACPNLRELVLPEGITFFASDALGTSGPVFVYGQAGGYLETYAEAVENLYFVPADSN